MSLLFYRHRIARAVAGDLSGLEELALREHLRGCEVCRSHYDVLTLAARASRGSMQPTGLEHERSLKRLLEPPGEEPRARSRKWVLLVPLTAALALIVFITRPQPTPEVQYRGGEAATTSVSLRVYAKGKDAPVRLVADLPRAGEARVSRSDWVQFKLVGAAILSGQRAHEPAQVFDLAHSQTLETGRWQLFIQETPLAPKQPAGVLWVE